MDIDAELVKKVAKTARLELSEEEVKRFVPQCKEILGFFSELSAADVAGVEPSFLPVPIKNVMREDLPRPSLSQEDALGNTPHKKDGYFRGPRAV